MMHDGIPWDCEVVCVCLSAVWGEGESLLASYYYMGGVAWLSN